MATISPTPKLQFLDANGNPLSYGLLYTYFAGTTVPKTTYTTAAQTTANTNPIVLDSRGEANVWLLAGEAYKFTLQNASGVLQYTVDQITAAGTMSTQNASNVAITGGTISGVTITGPITGNVTGDVVGNVAGNLTGNVTGGTVVATSYNGGQLAGLRNKIINGAMEIAQRGSSIALLTNNLPLLDRWVQFRNTVAAVTITQAADAPASDPTLQYSMRATVTAADSTVGSGEYFALRQRIEGYDARALIGTDVTISFWVRSSKTGIYSVSLINSGNDRSYIAEYSILAADTWEYKTITVYGGLITAGTWDWTNGTGVQIAFALMMGSTRQGATGSWLTGGAYYASVDQVNALDTNGNIFAVTGVQVEPGNIATPFEHRLFGIELGMCQRYYEKSFPYSTAPAQNVGSALGAAYATGQVLNQAFSSAVNFAVPKRAAPTVTTYAPDAASANWSTNTTTPTAATSNIGDSGFALIGNTAVTAGNGYSIHWAANAEL